MWQQRKYASTLPASMMMVPDILSVLLERERTLYSCRDYLNTADFDAYNCGHDGNQCGDNGNGADSPTTFYNNPSILSRSDVNNKITPDDRKKLVNWLYAIADQADLARETVAVAMNIVDRYMSLSSASSSNRNLQEIQDYLRQGVSRDMRYDRNQYQLISLAGLYIAVKLNERVTFSSRAFSAASDIMCSKEEIEEMERIILHSLDWKLCFPTSLQVGRLVLEMTKQWIMMLPRAHGHQALKATEEAMSESGLLSQGTLDFLHEQLAFQTEIAVCEYYFVTQRSSTIAIGSLLNAVEQVNDAEYKLLMRALTHILQEFDFVEPRLLLGARDRLWHLLEGNEEGDGGYFVDSVSHATMTTKDKNAARGDTA